MGEELYQRTSRIEKSEGSKLGVLSGVLVTDGEASDGHILNIDGVKLPDRAPLLFGHDDFSGRGNLGSWDSFEKFGEAGPKLGKRGVRGTASIELEGVGAGTDWRNDMAHMIDKGHINSFSVRWQEVGKPVPRTNLPAEHPAYVDAAKEKGRKAWGMYFNKWRLLEGSVVTIGADPLALMGRMAETQGDVRTFWRNAINNALVETVASSDLIVGIQLDDSDEVIYVERAAYNAMLTRANDSMSMAVDALHDAIAAREQANGLLLEIIERLDRKPNPVEIKVHRTDPSGDSASAAPEPKSAAPLPAIVTPSDIVQMLRDELKSARKEITQEAREHIARVRGKVR